MEVRTGMQQSGSGAIIRFGGIALGLTCLALAALLIGGAFDDSPAQRLQAAFDASEPARRQVLDFSVAEGRAPYQTDLPTLGGELTSNLTGSQQSLLSLGYDQELLLRFRGGDLDGSEVRLRPSAKHRSGWECSSERALPLPEACSTVLAQSSETESAAQPELQLPTAPAFGYSHGNEALAYLTAAMATMIGPKVGVAEFYAQTGRLPVIAGDFGFQEYSDALDGRREVVAHYSYPSVGHIRTIFSGGPVDKAEISLLGQPDRRPGQLKWSCQVLGVPKDWIPHQCRR